MNGKEPDPRDEGHAGRRRPRPASLADSLLYFCLSYGLAIVGYLVLNAAAARFLGTSDFGYFVVVLTVTTLLGQQGLLGLHRAGLREAARAQDRETISELREGVRAVCLVTLPAVAVLTGVATWAWRSDPQAGATGVLTGVLVFLSGYQTLSANFLRGLGHVRFAGLLEGRSGGALVALGQATLVLGVAWLAPQWGLAGALGGAAAGYVPPLCLAATLLTRSWGTSTVRARRTVSALRRVVQRDWRFAVAQAGAYVNSAVELWLAGVVLSAGATSLFAAGLRMAQLLLIPPTSLQVVFSPAVARLAVSPDTGMLQRLVRTGATVSTGLTGIAWLPMVLAPGLVMTVVFGEGFGQAAVVLVLLSTGYLVNALSGPSGITLSMTRHEGDVARVHWCAVAVRLVAGLLCAWQWGVIGLACSSAAVSVSAYAILWWLARRRVAVSTHATLRPDVRLLRSIAG
ncbi:MAG TPA: lipopolysaccharide biosynthesis protein [Nocardioidaceae bacterium]|nr:lipopolysaccharide biosynthesis protein [Nocardioidaceae bacterium]